VPRYRLDRSHPKIPVVHAQIEPSPIGFGEAVPISTEKQFFWTETMRSGQQIIHPENIEVRSPSSFPSTTNLLRSNTILHPVLYGPSEGVTRQQHKPDPVYKHLPSELFYHGFDVRSSRLAPQPDARTYNIIFSEESELGCKPPSPRETCSSRSPQAKTLQRRMPSMEMIREAHKKIKMQISEQNLLGDHQRTF
jgi:hypothetical protein